MLVQIACLAGGSRELPSVQIHPISLPALDEMRWAQLGQEPCAGAACQRVAI